MKTEQKADMSLAGGDGSREAGTGIGMATQQGVKSGEASFLDAAADQLVALDGVVEEELKQKKHQEADNVDELEEQAGQVDLDEEEEEVEGEEEAGEPAEEGSLSEQGEEELEEQDRVSIRLNGKKASLEEVLNQVSATVVVAGEDIEVTGEELIKGYQRGKDYSLKTAELSKQRDDMLPYNQMVAYAKEDPKFVDYVQSYFQNGPFPELAQNPDLRTSDADLAQMMDPNSPQYDSGRAQSVVKLRSEWQEKNAGRQEVDQRASQERLRMWNSWVNEQINVAKQAVDAIGVERGYEDKEGVGEYMGKSDSILEFLKASGYNEQEISGQVMVSAADARSAILAYKASEYDRMIAESDAPRVTLGKKRKRNAPPRSQKSGVGGTRTTSSKRKQRDSFRRASKEQTMDSWVDALASRNL